MYLVMPRRQLSLFMLLKMLRLTSMLIGVKMSQVGFVLLLAEITSAQLQFCRDQVKTAELGFTRPVEERNLIDFAVHAKYKDLHCCAEGYATLQWHFNGEPFPWERQGRIKLENNNQTLVIKDTYLEDAGLYTCRGVASRDVASGADVISHAVNLTVLEFVDYTGPPLVSEEPRDVVALPGANVTFYCEAYFGSIRRKSVYWLKYYNGSIQFAGNLPRHREVSVKKYDSLIVGAYLHVDDVNLDDYNATYECRMTRGRRRDKVYFNASIIYGDPDATEIIRSVISDPGGFKPAVITVACLFAVVAFVCLLGFNYRLEIQLIVKSQLQTGEPLEDMCYHMFVAYDHKSDDDQEFVVTAMLTELEEKCNYKMCIIDRDFGAGETLADEYLRCIQASQHFIALITPSFLKSGWCDFALKVALEHHRQCTFLVYKPIENWNDYLERASTKSAMKVIKTIKWPQDEQRRKVEMFWKRLRLQLPALAKDTRVEPDVILNAVKRRDAKC
ncbi:unnamed protein product [Owenia fusiformis]|uniref:Soluble interferon alpha/beta receptor OPG204 n=1 Tax=Owenia fusiformis TaxID=6347 RepID=A0A8J1TWG0_OWEFU|nr:unnamed protein product [Owenia fusiformis]